MTSASERIIRPRRSWIAVDLAALWRYRDLLGLMVRRDFLSRYQQTILGPLWFILQPVVTTILFTLVFGRALGTSTDQLPPFLFYLCGMLPWGYFSAVLSGTGNTFQTNAGVFTKVYFPRLIVPLATVISSVFALVVQAATFAVVYAVFYVNRSPGAAWAPDALAVLLLPVMLVQAALLALGLGLLSSALSAKYRDLQHALPFVVQMGMFVTPVIYPLSQLSARAQWFAALNPLTPIVEGFRLACFGTGTVRPGHVILSVAVTLVVAFAGLVAFQRAERTFADTV
jgi:lipopolysaccharide transport system permease protein